jgi:hypothetical protein
MPRKGKHQNSKPFSFSYIIKSNDKEDTTNKENTFTLFVKGTHI